MDYVIHILNIRKWEWESAKERMSVMIAKEGPFEEACKTFNTAIERIKEIDEAIKLLTTHAQD